MLFHLLRSTPEWILFVIAQFICIGVLHIGRARFEGDPYNHSYSSEYGDLYFVVIITLIAGDVLHRTTTLASWLTSPIYEGIALFCGALAGYIWQRSASSNRTHKETVMDTYHNTIVVAFLIYSLMQTVPLIVMYGKPYEIIGMILFGIIWVWLVWYDRITGRYDQPDFRKKHWRP